MVEQLTDEDLESFAGKLEAFGQQLPPRERIILEAILAAASESQVDVKAYSLGLSRSQGDLLQGADRDADRRAGPNRDAIMSLLRSLFGRVA
jgi:hypothetical protein